MTNKLINADEVAQYLNVEKTIVTQLANKGIIPTYRISGSFLRFDKDEIEKKKDTILHAANALKGVKEHKDRIHENVSFVERFLDFFYSYDFYILVILLIILILIVIMKI